MRLRKENVLLIIFCVIAICLIAINAFAAFSSTVSENTVFGNKRIVIGTYSSADGLGTTGGDIETGLNRVDILVLQPHGSSVATNAPVTNETFPLESGDVTIVTDASQTGYFWAVGK